MENSIYFPKISRDIISRFSKLYFFGYPLDIVNDRQVFRRLCSITSSHIGFCMESSAINMIALKGMTGARLVRGQCDGYGWHSWVEVEKNGIVVVVDNCWLYADLDKPNLYFMESSQYYEAAGLSPTAVCTYEEFWNYDLSHELYRRLSNPRKTALPSCLIEAYRPILPCERGDQFNHQIHNIANNSVKQRQFVAQMIQRGLFPHHPREAIGKLMGDVSLGFNFKQPPTIVPDD